MGKLIFTPIQQLFFTEFSKERNLKDKFYFGGGTALSVFYLQHRYSEDLDFFAKKEFDQNLIINFMNQFANKFNVTLKMTKKETVLWFELEKDNQTLKVDFLDFPYKRIEKGTVYQGVEIDSEKDIGANKILTINLENNPKDYVDLYFLLKKFTIWDFIYAVEAKFRIQLDLISLGEDFIQAEKLEFLPKMIKPLTLDQLKKFFRDLARIIGGKVIE
ncbi:nucleotidyl transferase AbiEii/AbiGii toxin family protein [Candidatus Roizmanbacteria bacterium]|nr:nucleotidyl transferase AbiEii/AbiGii toxin family protein [Candidatus Roizmanbacteria bacterium]